MIRLEKSMQAWGTPEFTSVLKQEIAQLDREELPLQQGLSTGNYVCDTPLTVLIHSVAEAGNMIRVKAGIFYQGILSGCSCADDPTPTSEVNEYCEVLLEIEKAGANATVEMVE